MHNFIYFIPIIAGLFLLRCYSKKVVWWEYLLITLVASAATMGCVHLCRLHNANDVEYVSDCLVEVENRTDNRALEDLRKK